MLPLEWLAVGDWRKHVSSIGFLRILHRCVAHDDSVFGVLAVNSNHKKSFPEWLPFYQYMSFRPDTSFIRDMIGKIGLWSPQKPNFGSAKCSFETGKKHFWDRQTPSPLRSPYLFWLWKVTKWKDILRPGCNSLVSEVKRTHDGWSTTNSSFSNDDKTEFIIIGTRQQLNKLQAMNIKVGGSVIKPSCQVKNLGSWLDPNLNMRHHITNVCKAGFFYLHNIRRIKKYLSRDSLLTLVHAFITSRLDYCNALFYGLPKEQIAKLQRVQNAAARLIMDIGKYSHITPALYELHWLPVLERIHFKILLLAFKAIHGLAPAYISNLLVIKRKSLYNLRSNSGILLQPPRGKMLATLGERAFQAAAPHLWNELPLQLRTIGSVETFKKSIKTFLFRRSFNSD